MECHAGKDTVAAEKVDEKLIFVGTPNVGKSVIFGFVTGRYVTVSNYPGTTVEVTKGVGKIGGRTVQIIDTPGINTLTPMSEDERVTRDILLEEEGYRVFQVCDAKNLERSLPITFQLIELGVEFGVILNMSDEAERHGIQVDEEKLSRILGLPVIKTVAVRRKGFDKIPALLSEARSGSFRVDYGDYIEDAVEKVGRILESRGYARSKRGLALMILSGDTTLREWLKENFSPEEIEEMEKVRSELERLVGVPVSYHINNARHRSAARIGMEVKRIVPRKKHSFLDHFGRLSMHPIWGVPIMLGVLYVAYLFVGKFGAGTMVDLLEGKLFGEWVNPFFVKLFENYVPIPIVRDFFVGDYGIITMALTYSLAIIFPIVGTFFIGFGIMEDSGYLPRLAVMVDRIFKKIGCNGKAVLPLILGLGCDTMATLTTRILETTKERIIVTLLLALGIPCSAQLGVVLGMLATLGPVATALWIAVVCGIILAVGYLASLIVKGEEVDFIMEIPPMRVPEFRNILVKTLARIEWYLKEAVPLFILGTVVLFVADRTGLLQVIDRVSAPVIVTLLDLPPKTAEAFIIGFLRRDYGAAGLYAMQKAGLLDPTQVLVSLTTITLFIPCIANLFVIIKERGMKIALAMMAFIFPFALAVGTAMNKIIRLLGVSF
ncbi:MAG: ferrous iron transport protein B [Deltaproteobacteria bacterium]|nr:MAG: ferrous iron transport protein B [Deltaproteobacteria bacterium]